MRRIQRSDLMLICVPSIACAASEDAAKGRNCCNFAPEKHAARVAEASRAAYPASARHQVSMSAQMFFAHASPNWPSSSFGAADTPPAPFTGCTSFVAGS